MALGRYLRVVLAITAAAALGGCQQTKADLDGSGALTTSSTAPVSFGATAELGKKWQAEPGNVNKGLAYASGLEQIGQTDQQLAVLKKLAEAHPADAKVNSLYGKKLLTAGRTSEAVPVLEAATGSGKADWRVYSALGSAYDQQAEHAKAREQYQRALALSPEELPVLNNLGMSHALEGDLKQAEITLRTASLLPKAKSEPRIRQNLALVIGLQGRFEEARQVASEDLPPADVEANMAYLKKMLSQPNTWQQLSDGNAG